MRPKVHSNRKRRPNQKRVLDPSIIQKAKESNKDQSLNESNESFSQRKGLLEVATLGEEVISNVEYFSNRAAAGNFVPQWVKKPECTFSDELVSDSCDLKELPFTLDKRLKKQLKCSGIESLFPVQMATIPLILESCSRGLYLPASYMPSDICVWSPTGSGKTLAFVLPLVHTLATCAPLDGHTLKALIVLPTKDLAYQVYNVVREYAEVCGLRVSLVSSDASMLNERRSLVQEVIPGQVLPLCDILVATPGRLVQHINQSKGFTLKYLRFLVIDEADAIFKSANLLEWLGKVESSVYCNDPALPRCHPSKLTLSSHLDRNIPLQKLLFSATFPSSPEVLEPFNLQNPKLLSCVQSGAVSEVSFGQQEGSGLSYTIPSLITEKYIVTEAQYKPLIFLHLISNLRMRKFLCFVQDVDTAKKLDGLVRNFDPLLKLCSLTRLDAKTHKFNLRKFSDGEFAGIIATDGLARGSDLNVETVIIYDLGPELSTYVHRVGRCGRAGRPGTAISLLTPGAEINKFVTMREGAGRANLPTKMDLDNREVFNIKHKFEDALHKLKLSTRVATSGVPSRNKGKPSDKPADSPSPGASKNAVNVTSKSPWKKTETKGVFVFKNESKPYT